MDSRGFCGDIRLLDRIHVVDRGREIPLGSPAARTVFALLALRAGTAVGVSDIIQALWGEACPNRAAGSVYTYVSTLRKALAPRASGTSPCLSRGQAGYRLHVPPEAVDANRFEQRAKQARQLYQVGDVAGVLAHCDRALSLWTGPALGGSVGPFAVAERARLDLLRLDVVELRCEALIETGSAADAAWDLSPLATAHPLRERLQELLMLALWRDGRQAEALQVYRQTRARLAEELGVEPGAALQEVHRRLLAGPERSVVATVSRRTNAPQVIPAQLPYGAPGFTGRADAVRRLEQLAEAASRDMPGACATVSAVVGPAGVGKTALLVHAAHRLADAFPDGQLFLDLRGFHPTMAPVTQQDALRQLLRSLGADPELAQADLGEMTAMYRSLLAGRRMLVVLDNAIGSEQVRPLLPGAKGCLALVSSRNKLTGLVARDGANRIRLEVLRPGESLDLLRYILGSRRVDADLGAASALASYCGHLPLALRIAAERIVDGDHNTMAEAVSELRQEQDRLDVLAASEDESTAVRSLFSWSYRVLKPADARAFRLLGLHPGVEISVEEAAALLGAGPTATRRQLESLVRQHLLDHVVQQRYRFHDLVRLYAAERARREESEAELKAAIRRILGWYLESVLAVRELLTPGLGAVQTVTSGLTPEVSLYQPRTYDEALNWAGRELSTLLGALRSAVENGLDDLATGLACALSALCHSSSRWYEWLQVTEIGQAAARRLGDRHSLGRLCNDAGVVHHFLGHTEEALSCHETAVDILTGLDDGNLEDKETIEANLAIAYSLLGRHRSSIPLLEKGLEISRRRDNPLLEASVLDSYGAVLSALGRHPEAIDHGRRCVELTRKAGFEYMLGHALSQVGTSCLNAGRGEEAVGYLTEAHQQWNRLGDRWGEIQAVRALAEAQLQVGRLSAARDLLHNFLDRLETSGQRVFHEREASVLSALLQRVG
ncbi:BTAD domain-containing putative transcriptional regulator [Streptomyces sp. NPDC050625]|uniref:AfsR/SARP family transcriptional regulator n=1 Tax=Streptomyces sp. NPDC050625 TaxID=3154629 RepID=UPI00343DAC5D